MNVWPGLDVGGDDVAPGLGEGRDIGIDRRDHQVNVEGQRGVWPQCAHNIGPDREIRHEMAVHHVNMNEVGAGRADRAHLIAEA